MQPTTNFPDKEYLEKLTAHFKRQQEQDSSLLEWIAAMSGMSMNWVADYITDPTVSWTKKEVAVDDLYLTGTSPEWNKIIIELCKRSPAQLRKALAEDEIVTSMFKDVTFSDEPILIRYEDDKYKVFDGMHRVIASIRDGRKTLVAFIAERRGKGPQPYLEPHVIYDLVKAYNRGLNKDRNALVTALRFLKQSYPNVSDLIRERFSSGWTPDEETQSIFDEVLKD